MNNILGTIVAHKRMETAERKSLYPVKLLERSFCFETTPVSLKHYLLRDDLNGIIAEFKRSSPSKGILNSYADVEKTTLAYMQAGASALSVLTDEKFFGGKNSDLESARRVNYCPVLRKDFVIDEYQVIEAKSLGADAILLIAALLTVEEVKTLSALAFSMGMEVLLELHNPGEIDRIVPGIQLVGINNRDLDSFVVNVERSFEMVALLPPGLTLISESGISEARTINELRDAGFHGFLMGEAFMKTPDPGKACANFISRLKQTSILAKNAL
ncbi:MAG: indole-3-glycerol phosphate synthase TrpC [Bacteroidota bacterium]|nr:indole-3-glycerol phosphate synthase TrpC [Bacteroidota bacterium]